MQWQSMKTGPHFLKKYHLQFSFQSQDVCEGSKLTDVLAGWCGDGQGRGAFAGPKTGTNIRRETFSFDSGLYHAFLNIGILNHV